MMALASQNKVSSVQASVLSASKRDPSLDFLKLFAISLVVLDHAMMRYVVGWGSTPIYNFIWLIQMPLFMIVSGLLASSPTKIDTFQKLLVGIGKKILVYLWPCFTFLLIETYGYKSFDGNLGTALSSFFADPDYSLWFLWVLFWIVFVFDIGVYVSSKAEGAMQKAIPLLIAFIAFGILTAFYISGVVQGTFLGIRYFIYYLPFYCLGYVFHLLKKSKYATRKRYGILKIVLAVVGALILIFEVFYFESIINFPDTGKYLFLRILGSVGGCYFLYFISSYIVKWKPMAFVAKGGKYTLEIYFLHLVFIGLMPVIDAEASTSQQWGMTIGVWFALMAITAAVLLVMYFLPFCHLLVFGKSWSFYSFEKRLIHGRETKLQSDL
jgi:fucose 4-O-acetylase-like acetyltransferase